MGRPPGPSRADPQRRFDPCGCPVVRVRPVIPELRSPTRGAPASGILRARERSQRRRALTTIYGDVTTAGWSWSTLLPAVSRFLGGRLTVGQQTLDLPIGVRIPASQPNSSLSDFPSNTLPAPVRRRSGGTVRADTPLLNSRLAGCVRDRIALSGPPRGHARGLENAARPPRRCSRERKPGVAAHPIHSSCGKPCGKPGHEDRNSLISNDKDQAAHKRVYCCMLLNTNTLINQAKIGVPVGAHSAGNPAMTGFSTIGLRECPTGRGFWRSEPCRPNSSKAFARRDVYRRCPPC